MKIWSKNNGSLTPVEFSYEECVQDILNDTKVIISLPERDIVDCSKSHVANDIKTISTLSKVIENNIKIISISWTPENDYRDDAIKYNSSNHSHFNENSEEIVEKVFLPIISDEKQIDKLNNITLFTKSYGSVFLGMIENCLRSKMDSLGYDKKKQQSIMEKIYSISVSPITRMDCSPTSFRKIFIGASNDSYNGFINPNAHDFSTKLTVPMNYKTINKNSLVITGYMPALKLGEKKISYSQSSHNPAHLVARNIDFHSSMTPEIFPLLIRNALNNAVTRKNEFQDLTELLHPIEQKSTITGQEGYGFTELLEKKLIEDFIHNGNQQGNTCRLH